MDLAHYREQFPVVGRMLFLNHASEAPVSIPVRRRIDEYLNIAEGDPDAAYGDLNPLKGLLARLLGGSAEEYAIMPNTATAINTVALSLPWQPGDNVVLPDEEYPANAYPWLALQARGVEVRRVPLGPNLRVDPQAIADRVDSRTRVVAVSAVEYLSGFRHDLKGLSRIAHDRGALLVVDGIQSAGALALNVEEEGIDVLAAGGYKWLLGPIGTGFAYIRRGLWEKLPPLLPGARSSVKGSADAHGEFQLLPTAGRYETGCLPFSLLYGWTAGLELLLEAGMNNVEAQVLALCDQIIAGLTARGYHVASPVAIRSERSGIISFTTGKTATDEALVRRLHDRGIIIALRGDRCRISPHFYNTLSDIDRFLNALEGR